MKGLECSIVGAKSLEIENPKLRLDSQFQGKAALTAIERIRALPHHQISNFTERPLKGRSIPYSEDGAFAVVRSGDISESFNEAALLRSSSYSEAFFLRENDVLISSIGQGSIGKVQLFRNSGEYATVPEVTVVRVSGVSQPLVAAFLSGTYGQAQIERYITGATGQLHLYPNDIDRIYLPRVTKDFELRLQKLYDQQWAYYQSSKTAQASVEERLLSKLSLTDWAPPEPLTYTASSNEVFAARRVDAQYFRPLFKDVEERLLATGNAEELGSMLSVNSRGRQPIYADDGLPVVNSKHVRTNRVIIDSFNRRAVETGTPLVIKKGDVLINGTGVGTIGRAAPYLHDQKAIPDNHVTVLRTNRMDPVYLSAFLNSPLGQWQIERHIKGSSGQIELYPNDVARIVVWEAQEDVQFEIRDFIITAFENERRANELLEAAKRAVEIAIEDGEPAAMAYLDKYEEAI